MSSKLKEIFDQHDGIMRTSELKEAGYYYQKIRELIEVGEIEQIRRGYYQYINEDSFSDIPIIITLFQMVCCAWRVHWITMDTQIELLTHGIWR